VLIIKNLELLISVIVALVLGFMNVLVHQSQCEINTHRNNFFFAAPAPPVLEAGSAGAKKSQLVSNSVVSKQICVSQEMHQPVITASMSDIERVLVQHGLINVNSIAPEIRVDLRYATPNNFTGKVLYVGLRKCYLQPEAAEMLAQAQQALQAKHPNYHLLILDCARPNSVQEEMWESIKNTNKNRYVADPKKGSIHSYGAAVDLTIIDSVTGQELDMGTPFDYFGSLASTSSQYVEGHMAAGKLSEQAYQNRLILQDAMKSVGFIALESEWWHFNAFNKSMVKQKYERIN